MDDDRIERVEDEAEAALHLADREGLDRDVEGHEQSVEK